MVRRLELKSGNISSFWFVVLSWRFQRPLGIHKIYWSRLLGHLFRLVYVYLSSVVSRAQSTLGCIKFISSPTSQKQCSHRIPHVTVKILVFPRCVRYLSFQKKTRSGYLASNIFILVVIHWKYCAVSKWLWSTNLVPRVLSYSAPVATGYLASNIFILVVIHWKYCAVSKWLWSTNLVPRVLSYSAPVATGAE